MCHITQSVKNIGGGPLLSQKSSYLVFTLPAHRMCYLINAQRV